MDIVDELLNALSEENRVMESLVEVAREKKRLIILGHVRELDELIAGESKLVMALGGIEARRFELQQALAVRWGIPAEELVASRILNQVEQLGLPCGPALAEQVQGLQQNINTLKVLNRENEDLINQSLSFIEMLQGALTREGASTYSPEGVLVEGKRKLSLLDRKV